MKPRDDTAWESIIRLYSSGCVDEAKTEFFRYCFELRSLIKEFAEAAVDRRVKEVSARVENEITQIKSDLEECKIVPRDGFAMKFGSKLRWVNLDSGTDEEKMEMLLAVAERMGCTVEDGETAAFERKACEDIISKMRDWQLSLARGVEGDSTQDRSSYRHAADQLTRALISIRERGSR